MQHIDEPRLESDVAYRFEFLTEFMEFDADDIEWIHASAEKLAPLVPALVDAVYDKLFSYDATKRHFVPRQHGYEGPVPESIAALEQDHEMIAFRKKHLANYLAGLVTKPYDVALVKYLDFVGKIHTDKAGSSELNVPLVQMNALIGFVADAVTATIQSLNLDLETERGMTRAFGKLLWLQNDLITRHYQAVPALAAV
ncbi:MAG: protoglobin family protein [Planctomycetaceae bacterium]